jgi:hypothetical protein
MVTGWIGFQCARRTILGDPRAVLADQAAFECLNGLKEQIDAFRDEA